MRASARRITSIHPARACRADPARGRPASARREFRPQIVSRPPHARRSPHRRGPSARRAVLRRAAVWSSRRGAVHAKPASRTKVAYPSGQSIRQLLQHFTPRVLSLTASRSRASTRPRQFPYRESVWRIPAPSDRKPHEELNEQADLDSSGRTLHRPGHRSRCLGARRCGQPAQRGQGHRGAPSARRRLRPRRASSPAS